MRSRECPDRRGAGRSRRCEKTRWGVISDIDRAGAAPLRVYAVIAAVDFSTDKLSGGVFQSGRRLIDDVHDPANGARTKQNRRRPAHNFHTLAEQGAHARGVIRTQVRDVEDLGAVVQDTDSIIGEAPNDRTTGAGGGPLPATPGSVLSEGCPKSPRLFALARAPFKTVTGSSGVG